MKELKVSGSVLDSITKNQKIFDQMKISGGILDLITKSQSFFDKMKVDCNILDFPLNNKVNNHFSQIVNNINITQNSVLATILEDEDVVSTHGSIGVMSTDNSIAEKFDQIQVTLISLANRISQIQDVPNQNGSKKFIGYVILFYLFTQIIVPQLNSLLVNLYTPYVQKYFGIAVEQNINESNIVVRRLSKMSDFRFVSVNGLNLRISPTKKAKIISKLNVGTLVIVLEKRKNWIKIETTINDCKIQGWAFTRYVKRFK